jgi:hypothetical protein
LERLGKWKDEAQLSGFLRAREKVVRMGSSRDPLVVMYRAWATREKLGIHIQK